MRLRYIANAFSAIDSVGLGCHPGGVFVMMIVPGDPVMVMLGAVDGAQVSARSMTRCACGWDWTSLSSSNISTGWRICFRATSALRLRTGPQPWK